MATRFGGQAKLVYRLSDGVHLGLRFVKKFQLAFLVPKLYERHCIVILVLYCVESRDLALKSGSALQYFL